MAESADAGRPSTAWWLAAACLTAALGAHFSFVLLHVLPINPISERLGSAARAYVEPAFVQTWTLFAPISPSRDFSVYARGHPTDGETPTPWVDVSGPLIDAVHANRLSPLNVALTVISKAVNDVELAGLLLGDASERERRIEEWADPERQPRGLIVLQQAGAAALRAVYPDRRFAAVQIMLALRPVPRFSEREEAPSEDATSYLVFRPAPLPEVVPWPSS